MRWGRPDDDAVAYVCAAPARLYPLALALTGSRHDADDLLQEALATVLVKWRHVGAADQPDAYVRRIMVNQLASGRRRRSAGEVPVTHETFERPAAGDATARVDERDALVRLLVTLPATQRAALALRYLDGMTDEQIADVIGSSTASVRAHVSRGLVTLRGRLSSGEPARVGA